MRSDVYSLATQKRRDRIAELTKAAFCKFCNSVGSPLLALWLGGMLLPHAAHAAVPVITTQPVGSTNTANTFVSLSVVASGTAPLRYQWYFNQTNALVTSGATTPTLTYTNILKSHQGIYTVAVSNLCVRCLYLGS